MFCRRPILGTPFVRRYASPVEKKRAGSAIQEHLDRIAQTGSEVVIPDIERLRPNSHASPHSPLYATEYTNLLKKLTHAFNAKQLRQFMQLYNLPLPTDRKKDPMAIAIMEQQWKWPSLAAIEKEKRAAEMGVETLPLTPRDAVLILGKDGAESRALSHQHNVRLKFQSHPLALRIEGTNGALKEVIKHINHLKTSIVEEFFQLPPGATISANIFTRISRLSGALVEEFGESKVRISFLEHHSRTGHLVRRLLAQCLCEDTRPQQSRLFCHLPPTVPSSSSLPTSSAFAHYYALFPFLSPRFLSWSTSTRGVFRVRRVEDWQGPSVIEDLKKTGGLVMGRGRLLNIHQQDVELQSLLSSNVPTTHSRSVIATMGHVLLTSPPGKQFQITPPLQGHLKIPGMLNWIKTSTEPILFAPTLPAPSPGEVASHKALHRLVYRSVNTPDDETCHVIKVEVTLPTSQADTKGEDLECQCTMSQLVDFDILMPDRSADVRLSTLDSIELPPGDLPSTVGSYLTELGSFIDFKDPDALQPEPPVTFSFEGTSYLLQACTNVRQKVEPTNTPSLSVILESAVDLEGEQKSTAHQVVCNGDLGDETVWKAFLALCDAMTSPTTTTSIPSRTPLL
ncbi:hypothetical protein MIND_00494400 [Mycena indigotica]|uniref:SLS1 N-terminal domain-containing protein n=1 Tax=Mycena indigotica TaxID=2126181 RepID=A0A8H6WC60_9AGAR|nr:uncharacterized protein MIND_00494400 [Mycena indigotica]KAF7307014.1 hypothetical protein MIND_00494400 [Mycena indigotica]